MTIIISNSWKKLLGEIEDDIMETENSTHEIEENFLPLVLLHGWMHPYIKLKVGLKKNHYEIADKEIAGLVNNDGDEIDVQASTVEFLIILHNDGAKALESIIKYVEQQEPSTGIGIMLQKMSILGREEMTFSREAYWITI